MKKKYNSPELELLKLRLTADVLLLSDPESTEGGGGDVIEPGGDEGGGLGSLGGL